MKTLEASQAALLAAPQLSVVTLCKLTTYSDRAAGTVQTTRYFSDGARLYDWANEGTVRQFEPWLLSMEPARDTMNHLPSLDGGGIESALRRRRTITLRNWLPETSSYLYASLRAENLEHARIEIAQLFIDRGAGASFNDLSALTGAEQTWIFRGEVASVTSVDEGSIELELIAELPQIPWIYANDETKNDPRDVGKRLPIVYGAAKHVSVIGWAVGRGYSTLAAAATKTATTIELTDASRFPASGSASIGAEVISWTGKSGNQLTTVTRGASSTRAVAHKLGEPVIETVTSGVWIAAGHPCRAIGAVYCKSPFNSVLVRIQASRYTVTLADTAPISGQTVASVSMTQANIRGLIADLAAAATEGGADAGDLSETRPPSLDAFTTARNAFDRNLDTYYDLSSGRVAVPFPAATGRTVVRVKITVVAQLASTEAIYFWAASSGGSSIATIANDFGVSYTGTWTLDSSNASLCGSQFYISGAGVRLWSIERTEFFADGSSRSSEVTKPTLYNGSSTSSTYKRLTDGVTDAGDYTFGSGAPTYSADFTWAAPLAGRTVVACIYRLYVLLDNGDTIGLAEGGGTTVLTSLTNSTGAAIEGWFELYVEDSGLIGTTNRLYAYTSVTVREVERVEIYLETAALPAIAGATVGQGLELYADVDGYDAPSASYLAGSGNLMTTMPDMLRHVLTVLSVPAQVVESAWNDVGGATYLDDNAHGIDIRQLGEDLRDILAALAYESRANLVADERTSGTVYRLLAALATYAWPAAGTTLAKWQQLIEEGREADTLATRFQHLYQWRPELGTGIDAFAAAIQTTVTAAETKFGRHDAEPVGLRSIEATATASEIAGYYEQERSRVAAIWSMRGVPWSDSYALERGDVVAFTPPWSSAKKARVIETTLRTDGLTDLRLVEVS